MRLFESLDFEQAILGHLGASLMPVFATRTCGDSRVISRLGVNPIGIINTSTAGGPVQQPLFPARFRFPAENLDIEFSSVVGVDLSGLNVAGRSIIVLVGRDVLSGFQLVYNGPGGFFTLAY